LLFSNKFEKKKSALDSPPLVPIPKTPQKAEQISRTNQFLSTNRKINDQIPFFPPNWEFVWSFWPSVHRDSETGIGEIVVLIFTLRRSMI
jgi:hypothetical protein